MIARRYGLVAYVALAGMTVGCAPLAGPMLRISSSSTPCRVPVTLRNSASSGTIRWTVPSPVDQRQKLDAWCGTAGPPVIRASAEPVAEAPRFAVAAGAPVARPVFASFRPAADTAEPAVVARPAADTLGPDELVVVTWNVHAGTGDVTELVRRLRSGELTDGRPATRFVLLLQEAMRAGALVPSVPQPGVRPPKAAGLGEKQSDIVELSQALGLSLYYVPSMRNGAPTQTDQDRGNAILSTEALRDFSAIELPFERQRRVAIQASVSGESRLGSPWTLRLVSAHLESTVPASRLWVLANGARVRQARGLLQAVGSDQPLMLAGDFNTWLGFLDPAYRVIDQSIPGVAENDRRPTFVPFFRLDHMFARLSDDWTVTTRRLDDRLGSDHFPIVARLRHPETKEPVRAD